jgi:LmbE family N-acetylglucosaminyl deacetylase
VEWTKRHRLWLKFVEANIHAVEEGKKVPLGPSPGRMRAPADLPATGRPLRVLICSPHPDDEALVGGLALRLRQECGAKVTNCAITLGSDTTQRTRRLRELKSSCAVLGFRLVVANPPSGFDRVRVETRSKHVKLWAEMVRALRLVFDKELPDVVFTPHAADRNPTHIGTHELVVEALRLHLKRAVRQSPVVIETEYWRELSSANLMVGISPEDEATLVMATAEHGGEVRRNPYHLRHPGRMIDNVRRGAEVVGRFGAPAPDFHFAEIYRLGFMAKSGLTRPRRGGLIVRPDDKIDWKDLVSHFSEKA